MSRRPHYEYDGYPYRTVTVDYDGPASWYYEDDDYCGQPFNLQRYHLNHRNQYGDHTFPQPRDYAPIDEYIPYEEYGWPNTYDVYPRRYGMEPNMGWLVSPVRLDMGAVRDHDRTYGDSWSNWDRRYEGMDQWLGLQESQDRYPSGHKFDGWHRHPGFD